MTICYLNDDFVELSKASISPLDRGFLFGDSVYEVLAAYKKNLFRLDDHVDRSVSYTHLTLPTKRIV